MQEFFRSWKRKLGIVTLLLGSGFMAFWVRSLSITDCLMYSAGKDAIDTWYSKKSTILFVQHRLDIDKYSRAHQEIYSITAPALPTWSSDVDVYVDLSTIDWRYTFLGLGLGQKEQKVGDVSTFYLLPYWSIVVPLTALSAWLLVGTHRVHNGADATARSTIPSRPEL